jgi:hypothetical protein
MKEIRPPPKKKRPDVQYEIQKNNGKEKCVLSSSVIESP